MGCSNLSRSAPVVAEDNKNCHFGVEKAKNPNITKIFILHLFLKSWHSNLLSQIHNFLNIYFFYLAVLSLSCSMWTHVETCVILVPQQGSNPSPVLWENRVSAINHKEIPAHKFWNAFISSPSGSNFHFSSSVYLLLPPPSKWCAAQML